jgi:hypothetical protein
LRGNNGTEAGQNAAQPPSRWKLRQFNGNPLQELNIKQYGLGHDEI